MTNCPWRMFIFSPSFQPYYKTYCILCDQRYMKLLWLSPVSLPTISACVYKNTCGHIGKQVRGPPLALRTGSEVATERPTVTDYTEKPSNNSGLPKDLEKVDAFKLPLHVFITKCNNSNKETSPIFYLLQKSWKFIIFACWFSSWLQEKNSLRRHMPSLKKNKIPNRFLLSVLFLAFWSMLIAKLWVFTWNFLWAMWISSNKNRCQIFFFLTEIQRMTFNVFNHY